MKARASNGTVHSYGYRCYLYMDIKHLSKRAAGVRPPMGACLPHSFWASNFWRARNSASTHCRLWLRLCSWPVLGLATSSAMPLTQPLPLACRLIVQQPRPQRWDANLPLSVTSQARRHGRCEVQLFALWWSRKDRPETKSQSHRNPNHSHSDWL